MIKAISIINEAGYSLDIDLFNSGELGLYVTSIDGLGPVSANVSSTEFAALDGGVIDSAHTGIRNIVTSFCLTGNPSVEHARRMLYAMFPVKQTVTYIVETEELKVYTTGVVESVTPNIFTNEAILDVSILCQDPRFYDYATGVIVTFSGMQSNFSFPFGNNSLSEDLIQFSNLIFLQEQNIFFDGYDNDGINIYINFRGTAGDITIYNLTARNSLTLSSTIVEDLTGEGFKNGDEVTISTRARNKSVTLLRDGSTTNILHCFTAESSWLKLNQGDNLFSYTATVNPTLVNMYIEYFTSREGV